MICTKCGRKEHFGRPCRYDGEEADIERTEAEDAERNKTEAAGRTEAEDAEPKSEE